MPDNEKKTGGTRFAPPPKEEKETKAPLNGSDDDDESISFSALFVPSADDPADIKVRKITVMAVTAVLVIALLYFVISAVGKKNREEPIPPIDSIDTAALTTAEILEKEPETEATTTTPEVTEEETTVTTEPKPLVLRDDKVMDMYKQNNDTVGWIKMDGNAVNSVVVQSADNDYYLDHDFYGNKKQSGFIYADFRCIINDYSDKQSDNIVLYGHNQKDGSMFGTLQYYKVTKQNTSRFDFYKEHPTFTFSNLYEDYTYKIVCVYVSESDASQARDGNIFDAHNFVRFNPDSSEKRSFENFVKNINERTEILTGVDMQKGDKFMTLSTCSNEFDNSRFIVIGRRVRDGESPEVDTSAAVLNPDVKEPDFSYILYGN